MSASRVFISYRREDAAAYAGRLCDRLGAMVGPDSVFMDVEDIAPGENFADSIDRSIRAFGTVLVVMGTRWTELLRQRSDSADADYVLHEVRSALDNHLKVIPVLVAGARMPQAADLPPALSSLALHNAVQLRDESFAEDVDRLAARLGLAHRRRLPLRKAVLMAGGIALAIALAFGAWRLNRRPADPRLSTAHTQTALGEHRAAFETYRAIASDRPQDSAVADLQSEAAMAWLRDFRVTLREGDKPEDVAGRPLAEIIRVLEAALARAGSRGEKAGTVLAHLGWAHWLNRRIAEAEFGPAAERALRQALEADPENVFGHAMLGAWLLQTHGDTAEALRHFEAAERTGRQRPFVRSLQLGGMIYHGDTSIPPALMRVVNGMRRDKETLDSRLRSRILSYFRPGNRDEIRQMLGSVPPGEGWATFVWLDGSSEGGELTYERFRHDFVHALSMERDGNAVEAIALLGDLERRMASTHYSGRLLDDVTQTLRTLR